MGPGGLRSLGVCVELLLVVVTSSLLPPASAELQKAESGGNANGIKTQLRLIMPMMMMGIQMLYMFDVATN